MRAQTVICGATTLVLLWLSSSGTTASSKGQDWPPPPKWQEKAKMARYLAHYATWGIVSAISPEHAYIPFGTLQSFSDGPLPTSSGTPYFYISSLSDTHRSLKYNNSASLTLSQAESDYCRKKELDPEEPTCARMTLTGKFVNVTDDEERKFAKNALFSRHPTMKDWPSGHNWQFFKMNITGVYLLDYFGGASNVSLKDYYSASPLPVVLLH